MVISEWERKEKGTNYGHKKLRREGDRQRGRENRDLVWSNWLKIEL